ncbi:MAG: hypothetical protein AAB949_00635 [Patescibacteria group bacterium]
MQFKQPTNLSYKSFLAKLTSFLKRRYGFLLSLCFIFSIAFWGWIFWQYAYLAAFSEPEVKEARFIKIKKAEMESLMQNINERQGFRDQIKDKTFLDPFVEKQVLPQLFESNTASSSVPTIL